MAPMRRNPKIEGRSFARATLAGGMRYRNNPDGYLWPALLGAVAVGTAAYIVTRKRDDVGGGSQSVTSACAETFVRHDFAKDVQGRMIPLIAASWPTGTSYATIKRTNPLAFLSEDGSSIVAFGYWMYPMGTSPDAARQRAISDAIDNIARRFCTDCTTGALTSVNVQSVETIEAEDRNLVGRGLKTLDGQEAVGNFLVMIRIPAGGYRCVG